MPILDDPTPYVARQHDKPRSGPRHLRPYERRIMWTLGLVVIAASIAGCLWWANTHVSPTGRWRDLDLVINGAVVVALGALVWSIGSTYPRGRHSGARR